MNVEILPTITNNDLWTIWFRERNGGTANWDIWEGTIYATKEIADAYCAYHAKHYPSAEFKPRNGVVITKMPPV